jgi:hypothetical protein
LIIAEIPSLRDHLWAGLSKRLTMSLVFDRREQLGERPGTHALVCGVGRYPFAEASQPERTLGVTADEPIAVETAKRVHRWLVEHADQLAAPLATCRLLLSGDGDGDERQRATLEGFLRAASAWRDDASSDRRGMTFCYLVAQGVAREQSDEVLLLEDFGDRVGGLLRNAIDVASLTRGMAPTRWAPDIARTQLFFVDLVGLQPSGVRLLGSQATSVFDAPLGEVRDDRVAMTFHGPPPVPPITSLLETTPFSGAVLACLEGRAAEYLPDGQWAVTTTGLARVLEDVLREQYAGYDGWQDVRVTGLTSTAVVARPSAPPTVPVQVSLAGVDVADATLVVRDGELAEVRIQAIPQHSDYLELLLRPGLYQFELHRPGAEAKRTVASVQPPASVVSFAR